MTGRDIFIKYQRQIDMLVRITGLLPRNIREKKLRNLTFHTGKIAMLKRYLLLKTLCKSCGTNVAIFPGCFFINISNLSIGNNVSIHEMCYIDAEGGISIGNDVSIAHRSTILSSNHGFDRKDIPIKYQNMILSHTTISNDVWIGCGCSIMAGVHISSGTVIGAGSVVTKSIDANSIVVGIAAKSIKER